MIRNYPIRFNKNNWKIKFYTYHKCDERCQFSVVPLADSPIFYTLIPNTKYDGIRCQKMGDLERSTIHLDTFDKDNPETSYGPLEKSNEIIIPDTTISVIIDYPLLHRAETVITSRDERGFNIKELIYNIKQIYRYIYREEERTANPLTYQLSKFCEKCMVKNGSEDIETKENPPDEEDCSICCDNFKTSDCSILKCRHIFHKKCIENWFDYSSKCPLCRENNNNCQECNGTYIVYYDYHGVVIPVQQRGLIMMRNNTDGIFGIQGYDLEDLLIKSLEYDRKRKQLRIEFVE